MFDKNKETRDSVNEAAKSAGEAAEEGKELIKETRQDINKVKAHFARNKKRYLIGGGIVVGTVIVGGAGFALGRSEITQNVDSFKLIHIQWKSPNVNIAMNKPELNPPQPILDKMTGIPYPSMNETARQTGETLGKIRVDAHGLQQRFEKLPETVFAQ